MLCNRAGSPLGQIPFIPEESIEVVVCFNTASELSFDVYREVDGVINPMWEQVRDLKQVWYKELNQLFTIQVDTDEGSSGSLKHITGQATGYVELGQVLLRDVEINTESDILREDYSPTVFYNPDKPAASLLHRLTEKAPHYSIGHVDDTLWSLQRSWSFDGTSILDALNTVAEEIGCVFRYDTSRSEDGTVREIRAYDLMYTCRDADCGARFSCGDCCPDCGGTELHQPYGEDTGIIVDRGSLTDSVELSSDLDQVKNCFFLQAGDDLMTATVRMCLPGGDGYLWHFNEETIADMGTELQERINAYTAEYADYSRTREFDTADPDFGALVEAYSDPDKCPVSYHETATGFAGITEGYYNAVTLRLYLQTSMMPTVDTGRINAGTELAAIRENLGALGITGLSASTSQATVESSLKNAAKIWYHQSAYDLSLSGSYSFADGSGTWIGSLTLTSEVDSTDTATGQLAVTVTDDYATCVKQQLEKRLDNADSGDAGIVALFQKGLSYDSSTGLYTGDFAEALKAYSADQLASYESICQTCLDLMIELGCGDADAALHGSYGEYYRRLGCIGAALAARQGEVDIASNYGDRLLALMGAVQEHLDLQDYLGESLYKELAAYRREDTYRNNNYISDGLSDSELIANAQRFLAGAEQELYRSANLQHSITASLFNLLRMEEFQPLPNSFDVGNWLYILVDGSPYRLRLLSYTLNFGDLQKISAEFSDAQEAGSSCSGLKSVIDQAASMATSFASVARQAEAGRDGSQSLAARLAAGLDLTSTRLVSGAEHQELVLDGHGLAMKRYDPITDSYAREQLKLTNTTLAYSDDDWASVKTAFGKYYDGDGTARYGLIGESIIGKVIAGSSLTISSEAEDGSGNAVFTVDGDGVSLNNAAIHITRDDGQAEVLLDASHGILVGCAPLLDAGGEVDEDKARLWVDTDGNLQVTLASGETVGVALENIHQINQNINETISGADGISTRLTSLGQVVDGLGSTLSEVQQEAAMALTSEDVQISIAEYVQDHQLGTSVTTETGFTFDREGLTIRESDRDVSTNIGADGMAVRSSSGDALLTVESEGVDAINLHARQYLIIGDGDGRSRFEDFGDSYTACFWIGS